LQLLKGLRAVPDPKPYWVLSNLRSRLNVGAANVEGTSGYFVGNVFAQDFVKPSDARIKKNMVKIDKAKAKEVLAALNPCSYEYIAGSAAAAPSKGFIAQELARVCPECVSTISEFIPNIYRNVKVVGSDRLILGSEFQIGDVLKAIRGSNAIELAIQEVGEGFVRVSGLTGAGAEAEIFVYGTMVKDFHVVSLQPIIALLVAAIQ
jgi:hypothetical protein